ncbi:hypothetical protein [Glycomyces tritici]|uniref:Uncharacterized protein n=1 Tax=Glycomyces tritici TaxID=2665176 RepID=A0ABT7YXH6_9ACTN|nr:hypothetical protein [Glycomyces tritici]MDN3243355.1 hypothetical protein [Glycomyces tritici]MDN3243768.1 hypothetical protein [Glycomyces tritici]
MDAPVVGDRGRKALGRLRRALSCSGGLHGGFVPGPVSALVRHAVADRKLTLPFVNFCNVPDLQADVSRLRELWAVLRGEDWAEDPELGRE